MINRDLEDTINQIYTNNLVYFKKYHPNIFNKIVIFENTNIYNCELLFNNNFELVRNKKTVYNCDPFFDSQHRVKKLKESESIFSMINIKDKYINTYNNLNIDCASFLNEYLELINNKYIQIAEKFIFLGTILGVHINDIIKEYNYKSYLIIENNIEIFRLSMFLTDYTILDKKSKIFFCIAEENKDSILKDFINYLPELNHQIKFELASENEITLISEISQLLLTYNLFNYPFSEYAISFLRGQYYFKHNKRLLKLDKKYNVLKDKKVLFLGGGLSLQKYIDFVKENKTSFIIVCVAATLKTLEKHQINPDIIISSDSRASILEQFNIDQSIYKNSIIIASNKTDLTVIEKLNNKNLFFFNDSLEIFPLTGTNIGVNVGNTGYSILLKLGVKEIFLLGFDASVDKKIGKSHSNSNIKKSFSEFNILKEDKIHNHETIFPIKGNLEDIVYTTNHYNNMIREMENINSQYNVETFNLSNGAHIKGTKSLKCTNLNFPVQTTTLDEIRNKLLKICKTSITENDKKVEILFREHLKILKNISRENLYETFNLIYKHNEKSILLQIMKNYFDLVTPFYLYSKNINKIKSNEIYIKHYNLLIDYIEQNFIEYS